MQIKRLYSVVLSSVVGIVALTPACSAPSKGGLVLAISTDMQTPKDVDVVSVFITIDSAVKFDYLGRVLPNGSVALPATLTVVEQTNPNAQVRVRVIGFKGQDARVLRDVRTTVPHGQVSLLRLPLDFLDDGSGHGTLPPALVPLGPGGAPEGDTAFDADMIASSCDFGQEQTSVNGECVTAAIDSAVLPPYDPTEVFGASGVQANGAPGTCFDVASCFAGAVPVAGLDLAGCSFDLTASVGDSSEGGVSDASTAQPPEASDITIDASTSAPVGTGSSSVQSGPPVDRGPAGFNLALVTPTTGACLASGLCFVPLESGAADGWTVSGNKVSMLPGICAKVKAGARLYKVQGSCAAKQVSEPVCESTRGGTSGSGNKGGSLGGSSSVGGGDDGGIVGVGPTGDSTADAGATFRGDASIATPPCFAASNCSNGEVCCSMGGGGGRTGRCAATCSNGEVQLCSTSAECLTASDTCGVFAGMRVCTNALDGGARDAAARDAAGRPLLDASAD